jgi:hypothetical protein
MDGVLKGVCIHSISPRGAWRNPMGARRYLVVWDLYINHNMPVHPGPSGGGGGQLCRWQ